MFVPSSISNNIGTLISKLGITEEPKYLPSRPDPDSPQNECFLTVEKKVNSNGGKRILGWQIWQTQLLVEAEFHAVWESPTGELVDITPKSIQFSEIMFVSDPKAIFENKQVNNVRINITDNPVVDDYIAVHEAVFRIENKGERALRYEISLTGSEAIAHDKLNKYKPMLEYMALHGESYKSLCPCNSGKKYKICHGKKLRKLMDDF